MTPLVRPRLVIHNLASSITNPDDFLDAVRWIKPDVLTCDDLSWQVAASFALKTHYLLNSVQCAEEWSKFERRYNAQ